MAAHIPDPCFYGRTMGLHSAWVLVALSFGAKVAVVLDVFFAVPVAVMITAVLQEAQTVSREPLAVNRQN